MFFAVIHRPEADLEEIKRISKKYDPYFDLIEPHVTLLFPIKDSEVSQQELVSHIKQIANSTDPFKVEFNSDSTELSFDQWLFLVPTQGKREFNELHDKLYSGANHRFLREDLPYSPHVGMGHFAKQATKQDLKDSKILDLDETKYKKALDEVKSAKTTLQYTATEIELIGVDDNYEKSWTIQKFKLGKNWGEL